MSNYVGITTSAPGIMVPLTLTDATARVAALLRRGDINAEIQQWLNFSLRELTDRVDFPELRVTNQQISLVGGWNIYPLPTNYSHMSSAYYKDLTLIPNRGWNMTPMPREFYKGDTVDLEKLGNRSVPSMGDPIYYAVDKTSTGLYNASDGTFGGGSVIGTPGTTVTSPTIIVYPAFIYTKVGRLEITYYRLPIDWASPTQVPDIEARWRHYLIYMAYKFGVIFQEKDKDSPIKLSQWNKIVEEVVGNIRGLVKKTEDRTIVFDLPAYGGLETADGKY